MLSWPTLSLMLQATQPAEALKWFTKDTLFTPAGATTAVIAVTAILQRIWVKFPAFVFALAFSLFLTLLAISVQNQGWTFVNVVLAILNGLVTCAAAVGVNTALTRCPEAKAPAGRSYRWWA